MAELVDALVSNTSGFTSMPVRSRLWVQNLEVLDSEVFLFSIFCGVIANFGHYIAKDDFFVYLKRLIRQAIFVYATLKSAIYAYQTTATRLSAEICAKIKKSFATFVKIKTH